MATKSKINREQSERMLEIAWRPEGDEDSSRNPIVEASIAAEAEAEAEAAILEAEAAAAEVEAEVLPGIAGNLAVALNALESDLSATLVDTYEPETPTAPRTESVSVRIDEVFQQIRAYRAVIDNRISENSLLGRSLLAQANAVFNTAFLNLQARFGFIDIYADAPGAARRADMDDATAYAVEEVLRLQGLLSSH